MLDDQIELREFLHHRDDLPADLLGVHRHFDVFVILEAVADDWRIVVGQRHHRQEFRLRSGFESEAVRPAVFEHFLNDLPLLVDLDRKYATVIAFVAVLLDGVLECAMNFSQAMLQYFAETKKDGRVDAAKHEFVDQFFQVDAARDFFARMNPEVPVRAYRKISFPPGINVI